MNEAREQLRDLVIKLANARKTIEHEPAQVIGQALGQKLEANEVIQPDQRLTDE
jgi:hypothetical protein